MLEAIEKFEEVVKRLKKLNYGDNNLFLSEKRETKMLLENYLPRKTTYRNQLHAIEVPGTANKNDLTGSDQWIEGQEQLIRFLHVVIKDLKIRQAKKIESSENRSELENYEQKIAQIKNDGEKDLIFQTNKLNYLQKKFDILQYENTKLKEDIDAVVGIRSRWITFGMFTTVMAIIIAIFDHYIDWAWFDVHPMKLYLKILTALFFTTIFLHLPLKDRKLTYLSFIILFFIGLIALV